MFPKMARSADRLNVESVGVPLRTEQQKEKVYLSNDLETKLNAFLHFLGR